MTPYSAASDTPGSGTASRCTLRNPPDKAFSDDRFTIYAAPYGYRQHCAAYGERPHRLYVHPDPHTGRR
ncbi:protein of unknown function [Methylococcus capsulatus]|uniref:Uncharacterized protein n=1 Tax=Methylococcus capsulatus TaxID=414 RepID=A0AA35US59_METCP|nr:protein of unknown function [Methylococcus capsulatus]